MEKNVTITVKSLESAYTVRGTMRRDAGALLLAYEEPAELELGGVSTELELRGERAVLRRSGAVSSELRFEVGAPHSSLYETAYGCFPAELTTHALRARVGERGGLIELRYSLCLGGAADEHKLKILIKTEE
ncbi:MAG: DUF1934 domain-containing protein [Oscillospiraceae bacterium]|nr:DUF1934 domain-containing protein [Oscillospiraceae bacterium]